MEEKLEHIGTVIIVLNDKKEILLGLRKNSYSAGFFGLPGGRAELGELLTDTVKRELLEECGISPTSSSFIGVVRENQRDYSFVHFGFLVEKFEGQVENKEPEKCEEWRFYNPENLPANILPGHLAIIQMHTSNETSENYKDL